MRLTLILLTVVFAARGQTIELTGELRKINDNSDSTKRLEFMKEVFRAIKSNKFENYASLFATKNEFKILTNKTIHNPDSVRETLTKTRKIEFENLLRDAKKENIKWESTEFSDYLMRTYLPDNYSGRLLTGHINIKSKNENKVIFGIQAIEINSRYTLLQVEKIMTGRMLKFVDIDSFEF